MSNSSVMNNWTNFERIAIAEYGSAVEFSAYNYGTISDIDSFQSIIENNIAYLGDATPNITGYITFMYIIIIYDFSAFINVLNSLESGGIDDAQYQIVFFTSSRYYRQFLYEIYKFDCFQRSKRR